MKTGGSGVFFPSGAKRLRQGLSLDFNIECNTEIIFNDLDRFKIKLQVYLHILYLESLEKSECPLLVRKNKRSVHIKW